MRVSIDNLPEKLRASHALSAELDLAFGDYRVRLRSNSAQLVERLRRYWRGFLDDTGAPDVEVDALQMAPPDLDIAFDDWPRDPGKVGRKEEYADVDGLRIVRKVRTGMQFVLGRGERLAFGPCLDNPNQVVNFIAAQYIVAQIGRGWTLCHAAGIATERAGLAVAGFAGMGKSTLALHLLSRGLFFVSNDRLLIRSDEAGPRMAGVPKQPRINPGTALNNADLADVLPAERRAALKALDRDALWALEEKYDVDIDSIYGPDRYRSTAPLDGFLVLNWRRESDEPFAIRQVDANERRDLLEAIMKPPGPFFAPSDGIFDEEVPRANEDEYLAQFAHTPLYEAVGRLDFAAAAELCLSRLLAKRP